MTVRRITAILGLLVALDVGGGHAQERIAAQRAAASDGTVKITLMAGAITVMGWDRDTVSVAGATGQQIDRVELRVVDRATRLQVVPAQSAREGVATEAWAELEVRVPRNSYVAVRSADASITVEDVWGGLDLESQTGDIRVGGRGARSIYAETAGGSIQVDAVSKLIRAKSVDGDIRIRNALGFVELATVSGSIQLQGRGLSQGEVSSVSGDIVFAGSFERGAFGFSFETHGGSIELRLPTDIAADFEVRALRGRVDNQFGPAASGSFTTGGGGPQVKVTSFKGGVKILERR